MNFQNLGHDVVKRGFVPKHPGWALSFFDFCQIEPRILAYFMARIGDNKLADMLNAGFDPYTAIVQEIYGRDDLSDDERKTGKILFLSLQYGGGVRTVQRQFGVDYHGARRMIRQFHDAWPGVKALQEMCQQTAQQRGYIKTPWGRHLHPEKFGEHKLLNKLVQGTAAEVMKSALLQVDGWLSAQNVVSHMVSVVHDEIQFDGLIAELALLHEEIPSLMCAADPRTLEIAEVVPILVDHDVAFTSWAEKMSYEEAMQEVEELQHRGD